MADLLSSLHLTDSSLDEDSSSVSSYTTNRTDSNIDKDEQLYERKKSRVYPKGPKMDQEEFASQEVFYKISNLPPEHQSKWAFRMLYRVFLRSPYPSQNWPLGTTQQLYLGLVNEMSLFPKSKLANTRARCVVQLMQADQMDREVVGTKVELAVLDEVERRWAGNENLTWTGLLGGKGAVSVKISAEAHADVAALSRESFMLKIRALSEHSAHEEKLFIEPLLVGPFHLINDQSPAASEELLLFHRVLPLPDTKLSDQTSGRYQPPRQGDSRAVVIREMAELAIPGKIWDSAFFTPSASLPFLLSNVAGSSTPRILDLSAGTGVCGIYMAAMTAEHWRATDLVITDLPDALNVIHENIKLNAQFLNACNVSVQALSWGDRAAIRKLGQFDLIMACDLIYEPDLLEVLVQTLDLLSAPAKTVVVIGYKQRGLTPAEKAKVFGLLSDKFEVTRIEQSECQHNGAGQVNLSGEVVGVELWKLWKSSEGVDDDPKMADVKSVSEAEAG